MRTLAELDRYCASTLRRSGRELARSGPLRARGQAALADPSIWDRWWAPRELDYGEAHLHPVWEHSFTRAQQLAWNHLQWTLDYVTVAQGEQQVVVLNGMAVSRFRDVLPSVCALEKRESEEEADHVATFFDVGAAVWRRCFGPRSRMRVLATSGFALASVNPPARRLIGTAANAVFGAHFPTLFFLARGMKSHSFKPFEIAMERAEDSHPLLRAISRGHGVDESRHIATSHHLAALSVPLLEKVPQESRLLFKLAVERLFPPGRMPEYRLAFWRTVIDRAPVFADVPRAERLALWEHVQARTHANLARLHPLQEAWVHKANRRIVMESGLKPELRELFVELLRRDPSYAPTVTALPAG
jgi:hypothetical protein